MRSAALPRARLRYSRCCVAGWNLEEYTRARICNLQKCTNPIDTLKSLAKRSLSARWAVRLALAVALVGSLKLLETALGSMWSAWTHICAALPGNHWARHSCFEAAVEGHMCSVMIAAAVDLEDLQHLPDDCRRQDVDMPQ